MRNNWPDNITIQHYLQGTLDAELMHELEKQALEDPFLKDALEGYAHVTGADVGLSILQRQLHERIAQKQEDKKIFDLSWQRLSVAAAAAVMFILAGILFWMKKPLPQPLANQKQVEVDLGSNSSENLKQVLRFSVQPAKGWEDYQKYLAEGIRQAKNNTIHARGTVIVGFTVNPDGQLSQFQIIQGLTKACNDIALRLIKEGPAWQASSDGQAKPVTIEIEF
ncbi:MAG TPA: energy transducer TonB [Daejeonella sp.]|nr:energy transducer TonB [Daejeonella sp.]